MSDDNFSSLLHISDLHLGSAKDGEVIDDFKSEIIPYAERNTRTKLLRNTLEQLARRLKERGQKLQAVIVSGDITYGYREEGFKQLDDILSCLGDAYPGSAKTVIVPGNHDVKWLSGNDAAARYGFFLSYVRKKGFITPLLEGCDMADDKSLPADLSPHYLIDPEARWAVAQSPSLQSRMRRGKASLNWLGPNMRPWTRGQSSESFESCAPLMSRGSRRPSLER